MFHAISAGWSDSTYKFTCLPFTYLEFLHCGVHHSLMLGRA